MKKELLPYSADLKNPWTLAAMSFMAFSVVIRLIYYIPERLTGLDWWIYLGVPGLACLWFLIALPIWGRRTLTPTCFSVLGGVWFFIMKAFTFAHWWHTALCICLYLAVLVLYKLTVTGVLPTKKLLYPLFGLPLAFHLFFEDVKNYILPRAPLWTMLPEISVLAIMAALLCLSLAMEQTKTA